MPYKTPELRRKNYLENKEKQLKQSAEYAKAHPESRRASYTKWAKANPDKVKANKKKYDEENKEREKTKRFEYLSVTENLARVRASRKAFYKKNRKREIAKTLAWQRLNPEYKRTFDQNRRAKKKKACGTFTTEEWISLCEKYDYLCLCCKKRRKLTVDHIVPLSKGGTNGIDNIQPLCGPCNSSKNAKIIDYRV